MALTETRPADTGSDGADLAALPSFTPDGFLGSVDHKPIGRMFVGGGIIFLLAGLVIGAIGAVESFDGSGFQIARDADEFAQIWSISRDLAVFGGLVPILIGIGLYIVPLQIGAPSLAFARGASGAFWTWLLGTGLLIVAYLLNGGPGGGRRDFVVLWACSLAMMIGAAVWALIVLASTILGARTVGMTMDRMPFTSWAYFMFSLHAIFSLPIVMGELLLALLRVRYGHLDITETASLTGVLDGVGLAPSIYWLGLPALGVAADVIGAHTGFPILQRRLTMVAITVFQLLAFGQDLVGMATERTIDFDNVLLVVGLLAAPLPVVAILGLGGNSLRQGTLRVKAALVAVLLSGLLLLAATVVSLLGLVEPVMGYLDELFPGSVDMTNSLVLNGTTFHEGIRGLVMAAALLAVIGALHHWAPKIWGRSLAEPMGLLSIALAAGGGLVWGLGEVGAGFADQPWYPASVDTTGGQEAFGVIAILGIALLAGSAALVGGNVVSVVAGRKPAGTSAADWSGLTLEWATASPPPLGNFPAPPIVSSATPLADGELAYDGLTSESDGGAGSEDTSEDDAGEES
ncbi:MAG: cbb3-type cytochrome c oxidase subunit I [Acidimicrobiia bacterium]|nr:cbb3-type cytochrome c oxidase subunit I [Acidimicrobiia bacterium]